MTAWAIIFFVAGMALILAEFIVPGMICGVLGSLLVIASGAIACYAYPDYALFIVLGELLGVCFCIGLGMYMLARTRTAKHLILADNQDPSAGWVAADSDLALVGAEGKAFTKLRPAGTILIAGKRIDAVANGGYIEKDKPIRVIEVHGSRVVVEEIEMNA